VTTCNFEVEDEVDDKVSDGSSCAITDVESDRSRFTRREGLQLAAYISVSLCGLGMVVGIVHTFQSVFPWKAGVLISGVSSENQNWVRSVKFGSMLLYCSSDAETCML
jgi:hypothetical protein